MRLSSAFRPRYHLTIGSDLLPRFLKSVVRPHFEFDFDRWRCRATCALYSKFRSRVRRRCRLPPSIGLVCHSHFWSVNCRQANSSHFYMSRIDPCIRDGALNQPSTLSFLSRYCTNLLKYDTDGGRPTLSRLKLHLALEVLLLLFISTLVEPKWRRPFLLAAFLLAGTAEEKHRSFRCEPSRRSRVSPCILSASPARPPAHRHERRPAARGAGALHVAHIGRRRVPLQRSGAG